MKKHVSLFLALLLIFSVLFAFPVEAAQPEQNGTEQNSDCIRENSICELFGAPRATDMNMAGNSVVLTHGVGDAVNACSHVYTYSNYSSILHKKTCTKCGYSVFESHNTLYQQNNSNSHRVKCTKCGRNITQSHSYTVSSSNRTLHRKTCSKCGYSYVENHIFKYMSVSETQHKKYCTVCGYSYLYAHSNFSYSLNGNGHNKCCGICGFSCFENHVSDNHTYLPYISIPATTSTHYHYEKCAKCEELYLKPCIFKYIDGATRCIKCNIFIS